MMTIIILSLTVGVLLSYFFRELLYSIAIEAGSETGMYSLALVVAYFTMITIWPIILYCSYRANKSDEESKESAY